MISIIIPAFNQLEYCRQCITSVHLNTGAPYKLILVDNGSTDGVGEYFDRVPGATVVHAGENKGFAGGVNLGLQHAEGHVVLLNSDTLTPRGWLPRLERALLREEDIGMVGPMSNQVSGAQHIDGLWFESLEEINAYADRLAGERAGTLIEVPRLVGFCLMIRDEVILKVGCFDERFGLGNFEDDDYCRRTVLAGYRLCVAADSFVFHYGSRTFHGMGLVDDAWRGLVGRNQDLYREKWQDDAVLLAAPQQRAALLTKKARDAVQANDLHRAIALYKQAIESAPNDPIPYNDLGKLLLRLGDPERARKYFERA
ncbi:MAG: glycosyltransferase, partial [Candidatus Hydrogenedentes bacterium]|nr:glycosyltransferase [Candidatus Hydrogenedentota bacterium]